MSTFSLKISLLITKYHPVSQLRYNHGTLNWCHKVKYHLGTHNLGRQMTFYRRLFSENFHFFIQILARSLTCRLNDPITIVILDLKNPDMSKKFEGSRNLRKYRGLKTIEIAKLTYFYLYILGWSCNSRKYTLRL